MAFGNDAATTPIVSRNLWATAAARSASVRENSAAKGVGVSVATSGKSRGLRSSKTTSFSAWREEQSIRDKLKLSTRSFTFSKRGCLSDVSTIESDDCLSDSNSKVSSASPSSDRVPSPNSLPRSPEPSDNSALDATGSLPGSLNASDVFLKACEVVPKRKPKRPRSPDDLHRIALQLATEARFQSRIVSEAFAVANKAKDGFLTVFEMEDAFQQLRLPASEAQKFFWLMDTEYCGRVYWREAIAVLGPMFNKVERSHRLTWVTEDPRDVLA